MFVFVRFSASGCVVCVYCVCVHDGGAAAGANGFTERNTAGYDVSRGVKAAAGRHVFVCVCNGVNVVESRE